MAETKVPSFELGSAGSNFKNKSKDIFGVLQTLEDKHTAVESARRKSSGDKDDESLWKHDPMDDPELGLKKNFPKSRNNTGGKSDPRKFNDKVDGFRKPYIQPSSNRRYKRPFIPDYKKHPEKYTCYSLGDVSSADMSDASNSRAAFDFLEERRKFREAQEEGSDEQEIKVNITETACSKGVFTFKKKDMKPETNSDVSKPNETPVVKIKELDFDVTEVNETQEVVKVSENTSFKRRKAKQRQIRTRDDDEDESDQT